MEDVSIQVDGGYVNVWWRPSTGEGQTAVLVHGLTGTSRWWTRVIDHLPEDMGIVSVDVRGRGGSHDSPPPFDLLTAADDLAIIMDHFELGPSTIAGYSMGAWVGALFAQRHPERVRRLLLVDGGLRLPSDTKADADDIIQAVVGPALARLDVEFADEEAFFDLWRAHPALKHHWEEAMRPALAYELHREGDSYRVRINPEAVRVSARQMTVDPQTNNAGAGVTVRSHLIVVERGTTDHLGGMIPLSTAEDTVAALHNMTMEFLVGVNHYTLILGSGAHAVASAIATS